MSLKITLGGAWQQWAKQASRTYSKDASFTEWQNATERFFDASQAVVHVITGRLRQSGSVSVYADGDRFVGEVEYSAPYALTEAARGGPHDYMQLAYEATVDEFPPAVGRALERMVERQFST
jgi:hypothetical protein